MRSSREGLLVTIEAEKATIQEAEWGDIRVGFEAYREEFDIAPLLPSSVIARHVAQEMLEGGVKILEMVLR